MDVVVTGAFGFVGLNVTKALAARGVQVIAIDRSPVDGWVEAFLEDHWPSVTPMQVDIAQPGALGDRLDGMSVDAFVHAAVITATTTDVEIQDSRNIVDVNVGGTIDALEAAVASGSSRFIYVSSPSAIGDVGTIGGSVGEDVVPRPTSLYGISKFASEQIVDRWRELRGIEAASVRISQPYGPGERTTGARRRTSPIWEWLRDGKPSQRLITGPLDRQRDWTYVGDTAEGIVRMVTANTLSNCLYHLGTGEDVSVREVVDLLADRIGPVELDTNPDAVDLNPNISGPGRPPLDVRRFAAEFGWTPETSIAEGMSRYFGWWDGFQDRVSPSERQSH